MSMPEHHFYSVQLFLHTNLLIFCLIISFLSHRWQAYQTTRACLGNEDYCMSCFLDPHAPVEPTDAEVRKFKTHPSIVKL